MQKRTIKRTNTEIPALGFGSMRLPTKNGTIDSKVSNDILNYALDNGIHLIDTGYLYHNGETEVFLSDILQKRREDILISTKLPVWFVKNKDDLRGFLEKQLKKLNVEYLDFYFLHSLKYESFLKLKEFGVLEFLDEIKEEGLVKNVGFSYHDHYKPFCKIIDEYPWDMCLLQYNYLDQDIQAGTRGVKYAYEHDVSVFVMEPLKGGLLANNLPSSVESILEKNDIDEKPAHWGLKWVLNHPEITCVLSGMTSINDVKENIEVAQTKPNSISKDELKVYDQVKEVYNNLLEIPCSHCNYCMPCPFNVDIPTCFNLYNNHKIFHKNNYFMQTTGVLDQKPSYAGQCQECGTCLSKCPQKINIPEELKKVKSTLEFPGFKIFVKLLNKIGIPIANKFLSLRK